MKAAIIVNLSKEKAVSRLFDIETDPGQLQEIQNEEIVKDMKNLIRDYMIRTDAPKELYHRYGIVPV